LTRWLLVFLAAGDRRKPASAAAFCLKPCPSLAAAISP
jgi:hypothetical protein